MGSRNKAYCRNQAYWVLFPLFTAVLLGLAVIEPESKAGTVIGIDLGTTYSSVGVYKKGQLEIIANDQGNTITPSWVAFTDSQRLVGEAAKSQAALNPERTIFGVKRLIGRKFNDPEVQRDIKLLPFHVVNKDGKPFIQVKVNDETKVFSPEEISAMVLIKMKQTAEAFLGKKIEDAVITVPAYFNDAQRQATKDAGTIAGLNVVRLISEPTAAALAYGSDKKGVAKNILIYDLGGGSFDVSIVTIDDEVFKVKVVAIRGDTHLGGEDFDHRIMDYFIEVIKNKYNKDISKDNKALGKLRQECERAKRSLSSQHQASVEIKSLLDGFDLSAPLTRETFEVLNMDLFNRTLGLVKEALEDANLKKSDIDGIVLVGGSTRIPKVQQLLKDFFDGKESNKGIDPKKAVIYGAAVQGGEVGKRTKDIIRERVPLSIGIDLGDGVMYKLISRNTPYPFRKSLFAGPSQAQQSTMLFKVYQGECNLTKDCRELGTFNVTDIPPNPRWKPEIEIAFRADRNGILDLTAVDYSALICLPVTSDKGLHSQEEIERMEEANGFVRKARGKIDSSDYIKRCGFHRDH